MKKLKKKRFELVIAGTLLKNENFKLFHVKHSVAGASRLVQFHPHGMAIVP